MIVSAIVADALMHKTPRPAHSNQSKASTDKFTESLPDITNLGFTWEDWKKNRIAGINRELSGYKVEADLTGAYGEIQIVYGILAPWNDPFMKTEVAKPTKDEPYFIRHGWSAIRPFMTASVADHILDWVLPDFKKVYTSAPAEAKKAYRDAVAHALDYLQVVDFNEEDRYLKGTAFAKGDEVGPTFTTTGPDGKERPFRKIEAFLYRRFADKTFTAEEMLRLVKKIEDEMKTWDQ